jgi:hypothetical protein
MAALAQRDSTAVSVGENAVLVLKAGPKSACKTLIIDGENSPSRLSFQFAT